MCVRLVCVWTRRAVIAADHQHIFSRHMVQPLNPVLGGERKATSCLVFSICYFGLIFLVPYSESGD